MSSSVSFAAEGDFESPYVSPLIQPGHLLSCDEHEAMCAEQEIQTAECDFVADLASRLGEMLAQQHIQTYELMRQRHEEEWIAEYGYAQVMRAFSTQSDTLARMQTQKKVRIPLRRKDSEKSSGTSACRSASPQVIVSSEDVATMVNYKLRSTSGSIGAGTDSDGFPQVSSTGNVVPLKAITEVTLVKPDDEDSVVMPKELPATKKVRTISGRNVPMKPARPTFTPQLFKTFSQTELKLRRDAQKESKRHSMQTRSESMPTEPLEGRLVRCVKAPAFDVFFTAVVLSNSIFIGLELQVSLSNPDGTPVPIAVIQYTFTFLFLAELLLRWAAGGTKFFCGEDWMWGWLDLMIVLTSLWEVGFEAYVFFAEGAEGDGGGLKSLTSLKILRIVRITRIVKAARLIRIFRFVMAFRLLIASIIATLKSLLWALMLLALIIYVFAILLTQAVHSYKADTDNVPLSPADDDASDRYFGSLALTMLSLFMSIAGGVSWEQVLAPLSAMSETWIWIFLFYISFTYFAVLNVVTAVFCQSAIDGAQNDHASKVHAILANKEAHLGKINTLFSKFGADDGVITFKMFQEKINSVEVREYFQTLGLDVWDAWSFFKLLDKDSGGAVEIEEFLMGCLRLRGQATAMDVGKIINDQQWLMKTQGKFNAYMEVELNQIKDQLTILTGVNCHSDEHIGWIFESHHLGETDIDTASDASGAAPSPGQGQRRPDTGRRSWMVQAILPSGPMSQSTCSCARITKRGRSSSCFWSQSRAKPKRAAGWLLVPAASLAMQKVQLQSTEEGFGPLQGPVTALVVFLHGRGDTGHNMLPVVSALASAIPTARFWLPTAPLNEQGRTSWYETDSAGQFDQRIYELRRQLMVRVQVDCQQLGLQLSQVAFAGFSQGSMIAALAGLEAPSPCAGLAVLCGGVPWDLRLGDASCDVPILFVAGGCDRTVTAETTRIAKERLLELGVRKLRYTELPELAHEISSEVVEMMKEFLAGCLPCQAAQDGAALHIPEGMQARWVR
eukprot:s387_g4.t3